jgi:hypothetical protein
MRPEQLIEFKNLVKDGKIDYDTNDTPTTIERKYKDHKIKEAILSFQTKSDRR